MMYYSTQIYKIILHIFWEIGDVMDVKIFEHECIF